MQMTKQPLWRRSLIWNYVYTWNLKRRLRRLLREQKEIEAGMKKLDRIEELWNSVDVERARFNYPPDDKL
jgi:hypothetical protein